MEETGVAVTATGGAGGGDDGDVSMTSIGA